MTDSIVDLNSIRPRVKGRRSFRFDWAARHRHEVVAPSTGSLAIPRFGDLQPALAKFLADSESVVGCVAWLTGTEFIDALEGKPVCLIVNKEKSFRAEPDSPTRRKYRRLTGGLRTRDFPAPLSEVGDYALDAVRCVGHAPRTRGPNTPLMHQKFAVRLRHGKPVAVWLGSFNWTRNASTSIECGIELHDPKVAEAFYAEFARVAALSEPLDFVAGKADPAWGYAAPAKKPTAAPARKKPAVRKKPAARKKAAAPRRQTPASSRTKR